ncbi:hypothetical protein YPS_4202 [Yersinia pestis Pestoides A]|nr:hypothetical protein YPS_4202 [Yersinia pestis Pestoides A]
MLRLNFDNITVRFFSCYLMAKPPYQKNTNP